MNKLLLVSALGVASIISQINMKNVAELYSGMPNPLDRRNIGLTTLLLFRVAIPSFVTLVLTLYCYTRFGFFELVLSQSIFYIFALGAKGLYFHEEIRTTDVLAVFLIIIAISMTLK